jgi:hypothetical protein
MIGSSNAREQHSIPNGEGHMDFLPDFGALLDFSLPSSIIHLGAE